jgi:hypothetical protein
VCVCVCVCVFMPVCLCVCLCARAGYRLFLEHAAGGQGQSGDVPPCRWFFFLRVQRGDFPPCRRLCVSVCASMYVYLCVVTHKSHRHNHTLKHSHRRTFTHTLSHTHSALLAGSFHVFPSVPLSRRRSRSAGSVCLKHKSNACHAAMGPYSPSNAVLVD